MTLARRVVLRSILGAAVASACACTGLAHAAPTPPDGAALARFFRAVQLDDAKTVQAMIGATVNANQLNPIGGEPGLGGLGFQRLHLDQPILEHLHGVGDLAEEGVAAVGGAVVEDGAFVGDSGEEALVVLGALA